MKATMRFDKRLGIILSLGAASAVLAGCSEAANDSSASIEYAQPEASADASADAALEASLVPADSAEIPTSEPQIAYTYTLGFDVPMDRIKPIQQEHAKMCEDLGVKQCRVIEMNQSSQSAEYASGRLRIAVTAEKARDFARSLETSTDEADGALTASSLSGEDLSKSIVDTEARLRSRELLRERLTEILASRQGTVGELVEAERAVAQVNQEIDQARSWLETMQTRVAFSEMTISYEAGERSAVSGGFSEPIVSAWNSLSSILGGTIAAIMMVLTALLPISAVLFGLRWVLHRFGYRLRFWKTNRTEPVKSEA